MLEFVPSFLPLTLTVVIVLTLTSKAVSSNSLTSTVITKQKQRFLALPIMVQPNPKRTFPVLVAQGLGGICTYSLKFLLKMQRFLGALGKTCAEFSSHCNYFPHSIFCHSSYLKKKNNPSRHGGPRCVLV